jgi:uncharacterized RDD family membrane protein YckC
VTVVVAGPTVAAPEYGGLVTRTLAFAIDVLIVDAVAIVTGVVIGLGLSALDLPGTVKTVFAVIGGVAAVAWSIAYFAYFWSARGQTPGDRVLGLRVLEEATGATLRFPRATLRVFALVLSAIPFCLGFVMILFDDRRRALHDRIVGSVVVYHDPERP